jgi:hypothetical protein
MPLSLLSSQTYYSFIYISLSLGMLHFQAVAWSDFILKQAWSAARLLCARCVRR